MGRGSLRRLYDIRKHPECYALLCREHHLQFDAGLIAFYQPSEIFPQTCDIHTENQSSYSEEIYIPGCSLRAKRPGNGVPL